MTRLLAIFPQPFPRLSARLIFKNFQISLIPSLRPCLDAAPRLGPAPRRLACSARAAAPPRRRAATKFVIYICTARTRGEASARLAKPRRSKLNPAAGIVDVRRRESVFFVFFAAVLSLLRSIRAEARRRQEGGTRQIAQCTDHAKRGGQSRAGRFPPQCAVRGGAGRQPRGAKQIKNATHGHVRGISTKSQ